MGSHATQNECSGWLWPRGTGHYSYFTQQIQGHLRRCFYLSEKKDTQKDSLVNRMILK